MSEASSACKVDDVLVALRRVIRATDIHSKHLAKTTGLTAPQLLLLQTIRDNGQATIGQLASEMSLSQATVTSIMDRLEKRGFVYRKRSDQDKRKVHAYLTEEGVDRLRDAPVPLQDQFSRQFEALEAWEKSMILSSIQRIATMMDAQNIDASPMLDLGSIDREEAKQTKDSAEHVA